MTIKELLEKRGETFASIEALRKKDADGVEFTGEDQAQWDAAWSDYDKYNEQLKRARQAEEARNEIENYEDAPEPIPQERRDYEPKIEKQYQFTAQEAQARAVAAWTKVANNIPINDEDRAAAKQANINVDAPAIDVPLLGTSEFRSFKQAEKRAPLTTQTGSTGGFTIPEGFVPNLERSMLAFGNVRSVARIIRTASGNPLPWPTVTDHANTGRVLAENTQVTETLPTFGAITFNAFKMSSDIVLVPQELMEDSAFNLGSELGSMLGERIARGMNADLTTGDGSGNANGVVTASSAGTTTAGASAITADELISHQHTCDPAYRINAQWMFHDGILSYIRKLKDGEGRYLLDVMSGNLLGKPYTINQQMQATVATATKTALFGDFSKYIVREVNTVRLYRLEERYRDYDQTGFVAFMRYDGDLLDAGTDPMKHLLQA